MDNLIIRVLNGEASPFEVERLSRWRDEAPENEAVFQEMSMVWELTTPEPRTPPGPPPSVAEIQRAAEVLDPELQTVFDLEPTQNAPPSSPRPDARVRQPRTPWRSWGLMAASVAALALGIRAFGFGGPEPLAEYSTVAGEIQTLTLSDGTFVRLAGGSRLQVWDESVQRNVSLQGKAFFAVTRDESRPFTVQTDHGDVRVLGTRFEVGEWGGGVRAVVVEGLVSLTNEAGSAQVPAGKMARMADGSEPIVEEPQDIWSLLDWPEGMLVFQETPLRTVAAEVALQFSRPVEVFGPELGGKRITAWFHLETFEEVTEALCAVVGATCERMEHGVTIRTQSDVGGTR